MKETAISLVSVKSFSVLSLSGHTGLGKPCVSPVITVRSDNISSGKRHGPRVDIHRSPLTQTTLRSDELTSKTPERETLLFCYNSCYAVY